MKAIRSQLPNQKLDGVELEMHQEAVKEARSIGSEIQGIGIPGIIMQGIEKRDMTATGQTSTAGDQGGTLVPTLLGGFIEPLKAKMILRQMGATFLTGLTGNSDFPTGNLGSAAWEGEIDDNADGSPTFGKKSITPHRLGAYINIAKQLLFQSSMDAQAYAQDSILTVIALAVELAAINGTGASNQPLGILNTSGIGSVALGANGALPTNDLPIDLESQVAIENADIGSLGYITNPGVRGILKKTPVSSSSAGQMVWDRQGGNTPLNGYPVGVTTQVPSNLTKGTSSGVCSAMVFGNFKDLLIAQWGGMDIVVDPYTQAGKAEIRLVVNSWWDVIARHAKSFAACKDILLA